MSLAELQTPPHNLDAEKATLGGVFMDPEILFVYEGLHLEPSDFYQKEHEFIFGAILGLWRDRKTVDVLTVADRLTAQNVLDAVGGSDYLYELSTAILSAAACPDYAKIVKEKAILRKILGVTQKISGEVFAQKETNEILDSVEKQIFDLTQSKIGFPIMHVKDVLDARIERYMELVDSPEKIEESKVFSKYSGLDEMLSGFKPAEFVILAARPSMGKTAFALNLALNVALKNQKSVAIFSLEMSADSLVDRMLSTVAEIPMYKITKGQLDQDDFSQMGEAIEVMGESQIYIDDTGAATVLEIKSKLRRLMIEKGKVDLVLIDYLQLMNHPVYAGNRVQEISEISKGLKALAKELGLPVIALSQLSRAVEQRIDKKPQLSDLRESGAIEQDADVVMMLHREEYYDPDTDRKGVTDVCIRKNRNGPVGEVMLKFDAPIMRFVEEK